MEQNSSERLLPEMYRALHDNLTPEDVNYLLRNNVVFFWFKFCLIIIKTQPNEVLVRYRKNAEVFEKVFQLHEILYLFSQRQNA